MPKNPVRAARQAGRQAVRAAKNTRRETVGAAKTASKVAKIEDKTAAKVGKISGTPAAKKATTYKPSAPTVKLPTTTKPKINMTGTKSTMKDMPVSTRKSAPAKKKSSEMENHITKMWRDKGYEYGKDGKVRDKNGKTPEENESQRVKDMFLQPGETPANTSPFASKEVAAKRALRDALDKVPFGKKKAGGSVKKYQTGGMTPGKRVVETNKPDPYTTKATANQPTYKRSGSTLSKNADGTYSPGMKKKGGSVKKAMYLKRK